MTDAFTQATAVLNLSPENRVYLKKFSSKGRQVAASQTSTVTSGPDGRRIVIDSALLRLLMVRACVVSWEGPIFAGRPVTPENIDALDPDLFDLIADDCDRLNGGLPDDLKNALAAPTSESS